MKQDVYDVTCSVCGERGVTTEECGWLDYALFWHHINPQTCARNLEYRRQQQEAEAEVNRKPVTYW